MKGISTAKVRLEGVSPLLMKNGQLANPMNEWSLLKKEITSKHSSKKTDSDEIELLRLGYQGSLYFDDEVGPYLPAVMIEANIREAAKAKRKGPQVNAGVQVSPDVIKLNYDGPWLRDSLYADKRFVDVRIVSVKGNRIPCARPRFDSWAIEFEVSVLDEVLDIDSIRKFLEYGGQMKALGDYRPKFGRFIVKSFDVL